MNELIKYDPNVQISGEAVLAAIHALNDNKDFALTKLKENGIDEPEAGRWYSFENWMDALTEISAFLGGDILFSTGKKIASKSDYYLNFHSMKDAFSAIDIVYHMNHRGDDKAYCKLTRFDQEDRFARIECSNLYPPVINRGMIDMVANWFNEENTAVNVQLDESNPLEKGGENKFYYNIFW